jgi:hypothetical protein
VGPSNLYLALRNVPEFQQLYADRIYKHFFTDGVLTPEANAARLMSIAAQIDRAIVGESARWGDGKDNAGRPATRDQSWLPRVNNLVDSYFPARHDRIIAQFQTAGLYSSIDPPLYAPPGGYVAADTDIRLTAPNGDIYYTLDGTDPRGTDGGPSASAIRLNSIDFVTPDTPARLLVPTGSANENNWQSVDFNDDSWLGGQAAFGYDTGVSEDPIAVPAGFEVREILSSVRLNNMSDAEAVLAGQNQIRSVSESGVPVINYHELGREAHFGDSSPFPVSGSDFVLDVNGTLVVSTPGIYTFGVTSNDAAKLIIDGNVLYADQDRHSTGDTFVTTELTAGEHHVNLVMFQRLSSAVLEFYFAAGTKTEFDDSFLLVGDIQHRPFISYINTDLQTAALDRNSSVYARIPFDVADASEIERMQLRLNYDDGFVAYLNGTEIARAAAPPNPTFDSASTDVRGDVNVLIQQTFDILNFSDALRTGENVLSIHSLNRERSDADLLVSPQLVAYPRNASFRLSDSANVKARLLILDTWSAVAEADFSLNQPASSANLRISEIHYHPMAPTAVEIQAGFADADDFEFIELVNIGSQPIDLSQVQLRRSISDNQIHGVRFVFSNSDMHELGPGQFALIVEDRAAFEFRYGTHLPVAGQWAGGLSNSTEDIILDAGGETIHQFAYLDQWHPETDGMGPSLERIDPAEADLNQWASSFAWRASYVPGGTPGTAGGIRPGDANRDGVFDSSDLLQILSTAEFEDDVIGNSTWEDGDWNGDGDFDSLDLILAFSSTTYQGQPPQPVVAAAVADQLRPVDDLDAKSRRVHRAQPEQDSGAALRRPIEPAVCELLFSSSSPL